MLGYINWGPLANWALQQAIASADEAKKNQQHEFYKENWWEIATRLWEGQSVFHVAAEYEERFGVARTFTIIQACNILRIFALNRKNESAKRHAIHATILIETHAKFPQETDPKRFINAFDFDKTVYFVDRCQGARGNADPAEGLIVLSIPFLYFFPLKIRQTSRWRGPTLEREIARMEAELEEYVKAIPIVGPVWEWGKTFHDVAKILAGYFPPRIPTFIALSETKEAFAIPLANVSSVNADRNNSYVAVTLAGGEDGSDYHIWPYLRRDSFRSLKMWEEYIPVACVSQGRLVGAKNVTLIRPPTPAEEKKLKDIVDSDVEAFEPRILQILSNSFYKRDLDLHPNIDPRSLASAVSSCSFPPDEKALGLILCSAGASNCVLFGQKGIYFSHSGIGGRIPYWELHKYRFGPDDKSLISADRRQVISLAGSGVPPGRLLEVLEAIDSIMANMVLMIRKPSKKEVAGTPKRQLVKTSKRTPQKTTKRSSAKKTPTQSGKKS